MVNDNEMKLRIRKIIKEEGDTITSFAKKIGGTRNNLSIVLNSEVKPVSSTILRGIANLGYDMNYIYRGENSKNDLQVWEKEKEKLLFNIKILEDLLTKK